MQAQHTNHCNSTNWLNHSLPLSLPHLQPASIDSANIWLKDQTNLPHGWTNPLTSCKKQRSNCTSTALNQWQPQQKAKIPPAANQPGKYGQPDRQHWLELTPGAQLIVWEKAKKEQRISNIQRSNLHHPLPFFTFPMHTHTSHSQQSILCLQQKRHNSCWHKMHCKPHQQLNEQLASNGDYALTASKCTITGNGKGALLIPQLSPYVVPFGQYKRHSSWQDKHMIATALQSSQASMWPSPRTLTSPSTTKKSTSLKTTGQTTHSGVLQCPHNQCIKPTAPTAKWTQRNWLCSSMVLQAVCQSRLFVMQLMLDSLSLGLDGPLHS